MTGNKSSPSNQNSSEASPIDIDQNQEAQEESTAQFLLGSADSRNDSAGDHNACSGGITTTAPISVRKHRDNLLQSLDPDLCSSRRSSSSSVSWFSWAMRDDETETGGWYGRWFKPAASPEVVGYDESRLSDKEKKKDREKEKEQGPSANLTRLSNRKDDGTTGSSAGSGQSGSKQAASIRDEGQQEYQEEQGVSVASRGAFAVTSLSSRKSKSKESLGRELTPKSSQLNSKSPHSESRPASWQSTRGGNDGASNNNDNNNNNSNDSSPEEKPESTSSATLPSTTPQDSPKMDPASKSYKSWAFWSRSNNHSEMAVSGTESESHPEAADSPPRNGDADPKLTTPTATNIAPTRTKVLRPNIVTPTLDESFAFGPPSFLRSGLQKLTRYILPGSDGPGYHQVQDHVYRCAPARIYKVVVIGVHGYFPIRLVRKVFGEPTGTSVKFANEAALAVERWADEKGYEVSIEKIALEGEGRVMRRVDKLYTLLCNWIDLIKDADFVFFAAHSQGTPVAVHLLARLISEGHLDNSKRIALLGMAGVCLGPMSGLDQTMLVRAYSSIERDSLSELFEFQQQDSVQSRKFVESLRTVLAHDAKLVFVGSVDDQLVPLYSSTCIHVSHPNIYRAAYVDGEDVSPEFVATLLGIVFRLRNIGSIDHGVVREISGALAGAITGAGHSKIYSEPRVYDLTIRFALETSSGFSSVALKLDDPPFQIPKPTAHNPYLLPWAVRGLLQEIHSRPEFADLLAELYTEFDQWRPSTKQLKDLKYRLSAIQSKL